MAKEKTSIINSKGERVDPVTFAESVEKKTLKVVFAHVDIVNDNGFSLSADAFKGSKTKIPVHFNHNDDNVFDIIGVANVEITPNDKGEFIATIQYYDTHAAIHARRVWEDGLIDSVSVGYWPVKAYREEDENGDIYIRVEEALLKEISLVYLPADKDAKEIVDYEPTDDVPTDEPESDDETDDVKNKIDQHQLELLKLKALNR